MSDSEAAGRILKSLDLFALQGYNSSFGKVTNDLYSKTDQGCILSPRDGRKAIISSLCCCVLFTFFCV